VCLLDVEDERAEREDLLLVTGRSSRDGVAGREPWLRLAAHFDPTLRTSGTGGCPSSLTTA
jgi:hypothetical protein